MNKGNWVPTWASKQSGVVNRCNNLAGQQQQASQGSAESLGGSSSGLSEMGSKPVQGTLFFIKKLNLSVSDLFVFRGFLGSFWIGLDWIGVSGFIIWCYFTGGFWSGSCGVR